MNGSAGGDGTAESTSPPGGIASFELPAGWRAVDFISDLHLAADMPRTFAAWAAHLEATDADAVFILGDLFEVWIGDDSRHDEFEARCAETLARAARRLPQVAFMAGNRDFLVGRGLLGEAGVVLLEDPTLLVAFGQRVLLTHGDELCLADAAYQRWRAQVRDPRWQQAVLARPLAERRLMARQLRDGSDAHQQAAGRDAAGTPEGGIEAAEVDIDFELTMRWLRAADASALVHGHTHRPRTAPFAAGIVRHVLSDWDLDHDPAHGRAEVLRLTAAGFERMAPAGIVDSASRTAA